MKITFGELRRLDPRKKEGFAELEMEHLSGIRPEFP